MVRSGRRLLDRAHLPLLFFCLVHFLEELTLALSFPFQPSPSRGGLPQRFGDPLAAVLTVVDACSASALADSSTSFTPCCVPMSLQVGLADVDPPKGCDLWPCQLSRWRRQTFGNFCPNRQWLRQPSSFPSFLGRGLPGQTTNSSYQSRVPLLALWFALQALDHEDPLAGPDNLLRALEPNAKVYTGLPP